MAANARRINIQFSPVRPLRFRWLELAKASCLAVGGR